MSIELLDSLMQQAIQQSFYTDALAYGEQLQQKLLQRPGNARDTLYMQKMSVLADVYRTTWMPEPMEVLYREILDYYKKNDQPLHPLAIGALNGLGTAVSMQGRSEEAIAYLTEALDKYQQTDGKKGKYIMVATNLASSYWYAGLFEEAEPLYKECVELRAALDGKMSMGYAKALNNLALLYWQTARNQEAISLYTEAKNIYEQLGKTSSSAYTKLLNDFGVLYWQIRELDKALPLLQESLERTAQQQGKESSAYVQRLTNIASVYLDRLDFVTAERYAQEAVAISQRLPGDNSKAYGEATTNLAQVYTLAGKKELAEKTYQICLAQFKNIFGDRHPEIASILTLQGRSYMHFGEYEKAIFYVLEGLKANCKEDLPNIGLSDEFIQKIPELDFFSYREADYSLYCLIEMADSAYLKDQQEQWLRYGYKISQAAVQLNSKLRSGFTSEEDKLAALEDNHLL